MNYKRIVATTRHLMEIDLEFWIEYIVRSLVPAIAFLVTCGLYVLDYGRKTRKAFDQWHINWITPQIQEQKTYAYPLHK